MPQECRGLQRYLSSLNDGSGTAQMFPSERFATLAGFSPRNKESLLLRRLLCLRIFLNKIFGTLLRFHPREMLCIVVRPDLVLS
jgi:hypothetical protein